jgi:ribosomal protein S18 acetylase RimI-like enzyme
MPPLIETLEQLEDGFAANLVLEAMNGDRIIGSVRARLNNGECYIGRLSVHPDFQNQGVGRALMEEVERRHPQVARFTLFAGSRSAENIGLYERLGYRTERREPVAEGVDLLYMAKTRPV